MQEVSFRLSPTFIKTAADANASLLAGYREAFSAALGIPPIRITVSVVAAGGQARRLLGAASVVSLLVVVQVVDYPQAVAVIDFAMTQSALYSATRAARLPDLQFVPDSVLYLPGAVYTPAGQTAPSSTAAPDRWKQSRGCTVSAPTRAGAALSIVLCALLGH
jgi:hypothetical protein